MYKTKYAPLHHSRTYTNVYIGIRSTSMSKVIFKNGTAFIKARGAQSVEHQDYKFQRLIPTMGKNLSF